MTQNTNEPLHIVGTDLLDYSFKVEQAIKQGYTFSDLNMYAPRAWPHMFESWMLPVGTIIDDSNSQMNVEPSESKAQPKDALLSPSVVSNGTTEGVGSGNETKAATVASKGVTKRGRK